jgi:hypothetical protein
VTRIATLVAAVLMATCTTYARADQRPVAAIAGVPCDAQVGDDVCFSKSGDLGARSITVNAKPEDFAQCAVIIVNDAHGHPAACVSASGGLILTGNVTTHVARLQLATSSGTCIGRRARMERDVACFKGGDLLLAGDANTEEVRR